MQKITQTRTLRQMVPGNSKPITPSKDGQAKHHDRLGPRIFTNMQKKGRPPWA